MSTKQVDYDRIFIKYKGMCYLNREMVKAQIALKQATLDELEAQCNEIEHAPHKVMHRIRLGVIE